MRSLQVRASSSEIGNTVDAIRVLEKSLTLCAQANSRSNVCPKLERASISGLLVQIRLHQRVASSNWLKARVPLMAAQRFRAGGLFPRQTAL